jgi:hypothetical protein
MSKGTRLSKLVSGYPVAKIPSLLYADNIEGFDVSKFLVSVRDDEDPSFTFRSVLLGTAFTALSSVITMLYIFKPVQMQVSAVFIQCEPQVA